MRADELVVLTKAEYDELKARAEGGAGDTGESFGNLWLILGIVVGVIATLVIIFVIWKFSSR